MNHTHVSGSLERISWIKAQSPTAARNHVL